MNKKKKLGIIVLFAVVSLAAFNMNIHSDKIELTDVSLNNVEALAQESETPNCFNVKGFCNTHLFSTDQLSFK